VSDGIKRMNNQPVPDWLYLLPVLALSVGIGILFWHPSRARSVLQRWALAKRYEILKFERCFFCGPFPWWKTSHKQMVFFITIRDDSGQERSGWVKFGDYLGGGYDHEPDIIWRDTK
jgi:hypothetical protein